VHFERTAHPGPLGGVSADQRRCGQGQDRTVDLPLFRRTLIPTELPDLGDAAVLTGFEPATSTLTGWRALQLLYRTMLTRLPCPRSQEHITDEAVRAASIQAPARNGDPGLRVRAAPGASCPHEASITRPLPGSAWPPPRASSSRPCYAVRAVVHTLSLRLYP
jgi:hypothetical protein